MLIKVQTGHMTVRNEKLDISGYSLVLLATLIVNSCGGGGDSEPPAAAVASCTNLGGALAVSTERKFPNLTFNSPLGLVWSANGARVFVLEKSGRILSFDNTATPANVDVFADLTSLVDSRGEGGLLGMALEPGFSSGGSVYLSYTTSDDPVSNNGSNFRSVISRVETGVGGAELDINSEQILLQLAQRRSNHNGGQLDFGPDGMLYVGFGDEGGSGDPFNNAQNTGNLYGAMLRIDVRRTDALRGKPYAIPNSNPFSASADCSTGKCPEILAWGLRNPWRWSFDRINGELWAGDVGQGAWEEVDVILSGKNYGWRCVEGDHDFNPQGCAAGGFEKPRAEYTRAVGQSITGGYVYRGAALPALAGVYLFGDFVSGRIWGLFNADSVEPRCDMLSESGLNISSFGQDSNGEVFVVDYAGGGIYRLVSQ